MNKPTAVARFLRRVSYMLALSLLILAEMARTASAEVRYLLIPDFTGNRVLAFDSTDGHLISDHFIPEDGRLASPKAAIGSGRGTVLVSDQVNDVVVEYGLDGVYIRTIADRPTHGIDNPRGIAIRNGVLYVTCGSGAHANTVQRISLAGASLGTFASTNLSSPFDILFRQNDVLVSNSDSNDVEKFMLDGTYIGKQVSSDGITGPSFPQQLHALTNGNFLLASLSPQDGIFEYSDAGAQLNYFDLEGDGTRGVHALGNGEILLTHVISLTDSVVAAYNRTTGNTRVIYGGPTNPGSYQYIHSVLISVEVRGTVTLENCSNANVPLAFQFRPTDGSGTFTRTVTPNPNGTFTVLNVPPKNYTIGVKGTKWLRTTIAANGATGDVTGLTLLLLGGDADNNNIVDINDLAALIEAFDATPNDANWNNGVADFDCNNVVDQNDLSILIRNFDAEGDA